MSVQILVATMHQVEKDYSLLDSLNLQSNAVVVNQCDREGKINFTYKGYQILWIDSRERGLSRSRNLALRNATDDICIICDNDEKLSDGYPMMVMNAYNALNDADLIVFNIDRIGWNEKERLFIKPERVKRHKTYGSVHLTFKRKNIRNCNIYFNVEFGTGSGMYSSGEDALFCRACHKRNLKMYTYPGVLCSVTCEESTWFTGYNEKYFYDIGAYLSEAFPKTKWFLKWYYPIRVRKISKLSGIQIILSINKGINGYKRKMSYEQYKMLSI